MKTTYLNFSEEELRSSFYQLKTREDLAQLLQISDLQLRYHLYTYPRKKVYTEFKIPKKSGGYRNIITPITSLKIIQHKLNQIFRSIYQPKPSTHGFTVGKSIVTNAEQHLRQKYILNIDLQDFFPSINFGRVRGLMMAKPYNCSEKVATVIAQLCCHENQLPQGAPSSPILSNMICAKLDSQLQRLAKRYLCIYTRYADDITFSTFKSRLSPSLAYFSTEFNELTLGAKLTKTIEENGFKVNKSKVRLQSKYGHQEVTGITVNERLNISRKYIRNIRATLHAWNKYGLKNTEAEFRKKYNIENNHCKNKLLFKEIVKGRIEFVGQVRGKDDPIYLKLSQSLFKLAPELVNQSKVDFSSLKQSVSLLHNTTKAIIWTEGKTDVKHLKFALKALKQNNTYNFELEFKEDLDPQKQGSSELLKVCEQFCKEKQSIPIIAIFDRDEPNYIRKVHDDSVGFKDWNNGVYSFALPIPSHRENFKEICIEHYYTDEELCTRNSDGRRIFLSSEFHKESGRHNTEPLIADKNKVKTNQPKIIDNSVYDVKSNNVALSKNNFADLIIESKNEFNSFSFEPFGMVFEIIEKIVKRHTLNT